MTKKMANLLKAGDYINHKQYGISKVKKVIPMMGVVIMPLSFNSIFRLFQDSGSYCNCLLEDKNSKLSPATKLDVPLNISMQTTYVVKPAEQIEQTMLPFDENIWKLNYDKDGSPIYVKTINEFPVYEWIDEGVIHPEKNIYIKIESFSVKELYRFSEIEDAKYYIKNRVFIDNLISCIQDVIKMNPKVITDEYRKYFPNNSFVIEKMKPILKKIEWKKYADSQEKPF